MPEEDEVEIIEPDDDDPEADDTDDPDFDDWVEGEVADIPVVSVYGSEEDGIPEPH